MLHGASPFGYHVVNALLHGLVSALVAQAAAAAWGWGTGGHDVGVEAACAAVLVEASAVVRNPKLHADARHSTVGL